MDHSPQGVTLKLNDAPVIRESDDELNRFRYAHHIAEELQGLDLRYGSVASISGPWGSGKTSLINFIKHQMSPKYTIVEFNPWLFSNAEDLVVTFFRILVNELKRDQKDFGQIVDAITPYLTALELLKYEPNTALFGVTAGVAKKLIPRRIPSVLKTKEELENALFRSDRRILVIIDDLDRLTSHEVREVLRLVRLVGSLPNVLYVLAFDRDQLAKSFADDPVLGEDYLEKVVFASWRVPSLDLETKRIQIYRGLEQLGILSLDGLSLEEEQRLRRLVENLLTPMMTSIRRIKRYFAAIQLAVREYSDDIDLLDLLALEALRLYEPDVFGQISANPYSFGWTRDYNLPFDTSFGKEAEEALSVIVGLSGEQRHVTWVLKELFPYAWKQYRSGIQVPNIHDCLIHGRVSHLAILLGYLERFDSRELVSMRLYKSILMDNQSIETIAETLASVSQSVFADVVEMIAREPSALPPYMHLRLAQNVMDLSARPRTESRTFLDVGVQGTAREIAIEWLRTRSGEDRVRFAQDLYAGISSLEMRFLFVFDLSQIEEGVEPLLDTSTIKGIENQLHREFSELNPDTLATTKRLFWIARELKPFLQEEDLPMPDFLGSAAAAWNLLQTSEGFSTSGLETVPTADLLKFWDGLEAMKRFTTFLRSHADHANAKISLLDQLERDILLMDESR